MFFSYFSPYDKTAPHQGVYGLIPLRSLHRSCNISETVMIPTNNPLHHASYDTTHSITLMGTEDLADVPEHAAPCLLHKGSLTLAMGKCL